MRRSGTPSGARAARAGALAVVTAGTGAALLAAGRVLPAPPPAPDRWYGWWQASGPVVAVFAAGRVLLLGLLGIWTAALVAATLLASTRQVRLPTWAATTPAARPVLRLALLLSASSGPLVACGAAGIQAGGPPPPAPVLYNVAGPPVPAGRPADQPHLRPPEPAPSRARPAAPTRAAPTRAVPPQAGQPQAGPPPAGRPAPAGPGPTPGRAWTVQPGDDLWTIAARALDSAPGRGAAPDVGRYWLRVIDANRARLPDPADPSLLFPGDTIVLPAL